MALNPKQKKRLKIGIIIASIATLLIATPIAAFYALFFDSRAKYVTIPKEVNYNNILADNVTQGMNKAKDENIISFASDEQQINELFKVFKEYSYEFNRYISNLEYNFVASEIYLDVQIPLFKTRIILKVEPSFDEEKQNLLIKINDIQLGRVKSIMPLANKIFNNKQIMKALIWMFETMYTYIDFDASTNTISYPLENIAYNLYTIAFDDPSMLFAGLVAQSVHDGHAVASLDNKSFSTSFAELKHPNKYDIPEYDDITWPLASIMDSYLTPMVKDKFFEKANDSQKTQMLRYLMFGYENMGENDQKYFEDNYDLTKYGIQDISKYESPVKSRLDNRLDIGKYITNLINEEIENNKNSFANGYKFDITLNEDDFRNSLLASPFLFSGCIPSSLDGENYHYAFVDNCYFNFQKDGFAIVSKYNVDENIITHSGLFNEKKPKETEKVKQTKNIFEYEITETLFGDVIACDQADWSYGINLYNYLKYSNSFMSFVTNSEDGIRQTTKKDYVLTFNFTNPISDSDLQKTLEDKGLLYETSLSFNEDAMVLTFELKG